MITSEERPATVAERSSRGRVGAWCEEDCRTRLRAHQVRPARQLRGRAFAATLGGMSRQLPRAREAVRQPLSCLLPLGSVRRQNVACKETCAGVGNFLPGGAPL